MINVDVESAHYHICRSDRSNELSQPPAIP
jgi:hypothetical protein